MAYYIDGPVQLGTAATATSIRGNISLSDTTTTAGDIVYANGSNNLQRLAITNNGVLIGTSTAPSWLSAGSNNQVLTVVAGSPAWATPQSDSAQYGFMVYKNIDQGPVSSTEAVLTDWDEPAYTDPEYDSTSGAFDPTTGVFTVPGTTGDKSRWIANVNITFTQSSNNNLLVTDIHVVRLLLNSAAISTSRISPGPRNNNLTTLFSNINVNFEAKGTDTVSIDVACKNGGTITVKAGGITWFGITKLSNV